MTGGSGWLGWLGWVGWESAGFVILFKRAPGVDFADGTSDEVCRGPAVLRAVLCVYVPTYQSQHPIYSASDPNRGESEAQRVFERSLCRTHQPWTRSDKTLHNSGSSASQNF